MYSLEAVEYVPAGHPMHKESSGTPAPITHSAATQTALNARESEHHYNLGSGSNQNEISPLDSFDNTKQQATHCCDTEIAEQAAVNLSVVPSQPVSLSTSGCGN